MSRKLTEDSHPRNATAVNNFIRKKYPDLGLFRYKEGAYYWYSEKQEIIELIDYKPIDLSLKDWLEKAGEALNSLTKLQKSLDKLIE